MRSLLLASALLFSTAATAQVPQAFVPSSTSRPAANVAGDPGGSTQTIESDGFLYRLSFDEFRDRPCLIRAQFWKAPAPQGISRIQKEVKQLDVCRGNAHPVNDSYAGWTPLSMQNVGQNVTENTLSLIDQIAIIDARGRNNHRVKAVRIRFGDLRAWRLAQSPVDLALSDYDSFRRPNAAGSSFSETSTCPRGRVATGIIVYHENNSITGLKLKCSSVRRVDEQPTSPTILRGRSVRRINTPRP